MSAIKNSGIIKVYLNDDVTVTGLIDSGSDVSLIHSEVIRKLGFLDALSKTSANLSGANGLPISVMGEFEMGFQLEGVYFRNKFLVVDKFSQGILLGKDFLFDKGAIVDFQKGEMKIGNVVIPFAGTHAIRVKSASNLVISGYKTMVVPVITEENLGSPKGDSIFIEGGFLDKDNQIFVPRCLLREEGMIQISNTSGKSINITEGDILATGDVIREYAKATPSFFCNKISRTEIENRIDDHAPEKCMITAKDLGVEDLPENEQEELVKIVNESGVIRGKLGRVESTEHKIETDGAEPINTRQYRCPISKREIIRNEAQKMIVAGIVKPSDSPWNSPVVLVAKPSGEHRFAIDFRKLNGVTKKQAYPVPRIDDCLNSLGTGKIFTCLDLESAYWQVPLAEEAKAKTAFSVEGLGHLEFEVMPYGLVNAGASFQRLMDQTLNGLHWTMCLVYLDDIIVFGRTVEEHNERLRIVLKRLAEANLTLKPGKCKWARRQVKYLGHLIENGTIKTDPDKTAAVREFPTPGSVKDVRAFLGIASYYRRFVPNFATLSKPLSVLTKTKQSRSFKWTDEAEAAFKEIKTKLTEAPCLTCLDQDAPLVIHTDASNMGLGAVLSVIRDDQEFVVAYASRQLKESEVKYAPIKKECLAIVYALKTFHFYIYGKTQFDIITDHCPLTYLKSMDPKCQLLQRWILIMQTYNFTITHRAGAKNGNADALSRCPISWDIDDGKEICPSFGEVNHITTTALPPALVPDEDEMTADDIAVQQDNDEELRAVKDFIEMGVLPEGDGNFGQLKRYASHCIIENGILYDVWKPKNGRSRKQLVTPKKNRGEILVENHENNNHAGYLRTLARIREHYSWPGLTGDVGTHLRNCAVCKATKVSKQNKVHLHPIKVSQPLELVSIDFVGPLEVSEGGNRYVITLQDHFSRWPAAYPVSEATSERVIDAIQRFSSDFGYPKCILSDRGSNFLSKLVDRACKKLKIERKLCASFRPQTNGLLERFHFTLKNALATYPVQEWDTFVGSIVGAYRSTPHTETKETPALLFIGRELGVNPEIKFRAPMIDYGDDYVKHRIALMQQAHQLVRGKNEQVQNRNKERYDRKAQPHGYNVGDWVWLKKEEKGGALDRIKWTGPFQISEVLSEQNIRLTFPRGNRQHEIVHANRLKRDSAVQREDVAGKITRTLDTKKVRGLNGRLTNKSFVELEGGYTLWVPTDWVE